MTARRTLRLGRRPRGLLRIVWCGWLALVVAGYGAVAVVVTVATVRAWHAASLGRVGAGTLVVIFAVELWWLGHLARRAAHLAPPTEPARYVALGVVLTVGLLLDAWMVLGR